MADFYFIIETLNLSICIAKYATSSSDIVGISKVLQIIFFVSSAISYDTPYFSFIISIKSFFIGVSVIILSMANLI